MATFYSEADVDRSKFAGKKIAVIGYGSQGRAQALNLRDSGLDVIIGLRPGGASWKLAEEDGFKPMDPAEATAAADIIALLVPDMAMPAVYKESVEPNLKEGAAVLFSHGFKHTL